MVHEAWRLSSRAEIKQTLQSVERLSAMPVHTDPVAVIQDHMTRRHKHIVEIDKN